jgi:glutamate synthase (NADPH/NADH) small chain
MNPEPPTHGLAKYAWMEIDRVEPPVRPAADRVADFRETTAPYDEATAREQASRCIQCPHPTCVEACPLQCPIPELLMLIADGQFTEATRLYFNTNQIPELASHVCVGGRVCERSCILAEKTYPVPIRSLTRFLLDYGWKHGLAEPVVAPAKNRSVAVLGSGMGGMVSADALSRKGYRVTVFDSRQKPGGRMMNGLPGFRMDKDLVERRIGLLEQRGISFRMGVTFGQDVKLSDLRRDFDAVYLGFGLLDAVPLEVPGADLRGVHPALPFLTRNMPAACETHANADGPPGTTATTMPPVDVRGKRVVVLGGGDTAMDVLRTAIRDGAADALCLYRRDMACMPVDLEEYTKAEEEGARFGFLTQPVAVVGNAAGEVTAVRCIPTELSDPDKSRRPAWLPVAGAAEFDVPADVVFVAFGFTAPKLPASDDFALLATNERGYLIVDENRMTSLPGVFAGGSIARGPVPLVQVVCDARKATAAIDRFLGR